MSGVRQPVRRCRSVSCKRARRELLDYFALGEELGSRSDPYLAHMQSCAECRDEVGIDRALVKSLRRALRERVEGSAPSQSSWELVRRRTVDSPKRPWTVHVVRWGGMVSTAAAAGVMLFAVATTPESPMLSGPRSPFAASVARRAVPPIDEGTGLAAAQTSAYVAPHTEAPLPGWPVRTQLSSYVATRDGDPPVTGHRR
jgi:anti-sigma factor RsiW